MKFIVLIFCASFLFLGYILADSSEADNLSNEYEEEELRGAVDNLINTTINALLSNLSDPIKVDTFSTDFKNVILTGQFSISDLNLAGLRGIVASKIKALLTSPSSINITVESKNINFFSNYDMNLIVGQILPLFGKGNISLNLDDINVDIFALATIKLIPISISGINNISVAFSVGEKTSFSLYGLLKNDEFDELLNKIIAEYTPRIIDFLNVNKDRVGKVISAIIQSIIDSIIKEDTVDEILHNIYMQLI